MSHKYLLTQRKYPPEEAIFAQCKFSNIGSSRDC